MIPTLYHFRGAITLSDLRAMTMTDLDEINHYLKEIGVYE